jgi:extradiol dioxygenase family protein
MFRGIQHVAVGVDDLAAAQRFHGEVLGLDDEARDAGTQRGCPKLGDGCRYR